MSRKSLKFYEEILLLALDDDAGTVQMGSQYNNAMAGAILAELVLNGSLHIADGKKKTVTLAAGATTETDVILAEALTKVREANKPKQAKDWVLKFTGIKDLKNRVGRQLAARGILAEETDQVLVFFKRTVFPERDGGPERELRRRLEEAVFTDTANVVPRTVVILALLKATNMLDKVLGKKKVKERKDRVKALVEGELVGQATREAVQAMQAAILVCAVVPAVVVTTT